MYFLCKVQSLCNNLASLSNRGSSIQCPYMNLFTSYKFVICYLYTTNMGNFIIPSISIFGLTKFTELVVFSNFSSFLDLFFLFLAILFA